MELKEELQGCRRPRIHSVLQNPLHGVERDIKPGPASIGSMGWESITWSWKLDNRVYGALHVYPLRIHYMELKGGQMPWGRLLYLHLVLESITWSWKGWFWTGGHTGQPPPESITWSWKILNASSWPIVVRPSTGIHYMELKGLVWHHLSPCLRRESITWSWK